MGETALGAALGKKRVVQLKRNRTSFSFCWKWKEKEASRRNRRGEVEPRWCCCGIAAARLLPVLEAWFSSSTEGDRASLRLGEDGQWQLHRHPRPRPSRR